MSSKKKISDIALFGGSSLFEAPKSTSNLYKPDFNNFLKYSKVFFDQHQYTNNGPVVRLLEQRLADFHQTKYCISFCSGFWALVLAIKALYSQGKTEIIMPSLTYRRMADIAAWTELRPHFCEVEKDTLAMSAETVKPCINDNTALILGVHPIVNCCDVDGLVALSKEQNIPLLFDSVESVYESTSSGKIGTFGAAEVFSMHASKLLNGFEGGYLTTNNEKIYKILFATRTFGFSGMDNITKKDGMNAKLNEIHAAMALASLDGIDEILYHNRQIYYTYKKILSGIPGIRLLEFDERYQTGFKNIVVELLDQWPLSRADTINILDAEYLLARAYYYPALHSKHMQYPYVVKDLPITEYLSERFMTLPCGHHVGKGDVLIIGNFLNFIQANSDTISQHLSMGRISRNEN